MSAYEFRQKLRRYNILSQKCEVKKTELNLAYKRALKESDDSYHRLSTLASTTSPKNYTSTALQNTSQFSYSAVSPSKNSLNISRHSPTRSNFNTNTNTHINFNSLLSNSPINKPNSKAEDEFLNHKQEKIDTNLRPNEKKKDDELEDDQAIFDIIHSKNENSKQSNSDTDEEFQRLVQQADDEENEKKKLEDNHNQKSNEEINVEEEAEEDLDENFEFHPDENEEDINDENEIDFEKKEDGNQFEVDEEEDIHNDEEENKNPFEPDNVNYDDDIKNENHDELFEEEEEELTVQSPKKNIVKAIANKVTSSNDADQATNKENEAGSIMSNEEVNDHIPTDIQNDDN